MQEKKVTSASYIIEFYSDVQILNGKYSVYNNYLLEIRNKYDNKEDLKLDDEDKKLLLNAVQECRYYITKTFISYVTISKVLATKKVKIRDLTTELKELADSINKNLIDVKEEVNDYVLLINEALLQEVIGELLETSQQIINTMYNE